MIVIQYKCYHCQIIEWKQQKVTPTPVHILNFSQYTIHGKYISAHFALITSIWNVSYGKSLSSAIPDIDDSHIFSLPRSHLCKSPFSIQSNQLSYILIGLLSILFYQFWSLQRAFGWKIWKVEIENMWNSQYGMANKPQPYKDWTNIDIEPLAQIFQIRSAPFQTSLRKLKRLWTYGIWLNGFEC